MNDSELNPTHDMETPKDLTAKLKVLESIRTRFADTLYFLMPGVDHLLFTLSHGP